MDAWVEVNSRLLVKQIKEWGEILLGFESRNRFELGQFAGGPSGELYLIEEEVEGSLGASGPPDLDVVIEIAPGSGGGSGGGGGGNGNGNGNGGGNGKPK